MSCGMKMYFHAYLNMEVVITLSTVPDILLRHEKSHFIVVGTDHKMAVLGYWQDCWCTRTDEQDITNLSHTLPFYYVILLLDDIQFLASTVKENAATSQFYSVTGHTLLQHMTKSTMAWVQVSNTVTGMDKYCTHCFQGAFARSQEHVRLTALQQSFRQSSHPIRCYAGYK